MSKLRSTISFSRRKLEAEDHEIPTHLKAVLVVDGGPDAGRTLDLTSGVTVVGRSASADLQVEDDAMSRRHFSIGYRNLEFRIGDLDSSNGTYLNGSTVRDYALRNGDSIRAGESTFTFRVSRADA